MVLEKLELQNFRSYKKASFEFSPETTLIVGPNTSGKTNILEAIFLLALGRTFRPGLEREIIRWGEEWARVKAVVSRSKRIMNNELRTELEVVLTRGEVLGKQAPLKKLLVNGVSRRLYNFVGNLQVVMFGPEDLELVTNSPSLRRAHLDFVLEQVDEEYRRESVIYGKALIQRNRLLKMIGEGRRSKGELEYWDKLLIENGSYITKKRCEFFDFVNKLPKKLGEFEFVYQVSEIGLERLEKLRGREIAAGMTLVGPHRDDFVFKIRPSSRAQVEGNPKSETRNRNLTISGSLGESRKSRDLSIYGSRGEQRTAVLALKLAELEFMDYQVRGDRSEGIGGRPVLLLDDIFSELDSDNRKEVLKVIPKQQTIITTTDLGLVEKRFLDRMKIHRCKHTD